MGSLEEELSKIEQDIQTYEFLLQCQTPLQQFAFGNEEKLKQELAEELQKEIECNNQLAKIFTDIATKLNVEYIDYDREKDDLPLGMSQQILFRQRVANLRLLSFYQKGVIAGREYKEQIQQRARKRTFSNDDDDDDNNFFIRKTTKEVVPVSHFTTQPHPSAKKLKTVRFRV